MPGRNDGLPGRNSVDYDTRSKFCGRFFAEEFFMRGPATVAAAVAALLALSSAARANISVCNDHSATIHVALANQVNGSYTASGWWTVPKNACQVVDFTLQNSTFYYVAVSDDNEHWGNKVQLYVSTNMTGKFNYANADKSRSGAKAEMFGSASMGQDQSLSKLATLTLHIKNDGSSIEFTTKQ
jgi:uncharacterized membrane protein